MREQAEILLARLRTLRRATFRQLIADCAGTYEVVARFLAVLELYRDGLVGLDQVAPLGDLYVSWTDQAATQRRLAMITRNTMDNGPAGASWSGR